jgi:hypothetical protein
MSIFDSPSFGVDSTGAFGGIGSSLNQNPLGGFGGLNVGGFTGAAPSYGGGGGGFGGLGQFAPLIAGRFGSMLAGNANTAQSAQNAMNTSIGMFDVNQGVTASNRRQAIFDEMMAPIQASRIKMNPEYRRGQLRDTLRDRGTRYSAFVG